MKTITIITLCLVFTLSLSAQRNSANEQLQAIHAESVSYKSNTPIQKDRREAIRQELKKMNSSILRDESVLDSIVYYGSITETDSVKSSKTEYDWYDSALPKTKVDYIWNNDNNQWIKAAKTEYTFDENGNETSYYTFIWDTVQNSWTNEKKLDMTFDTYGFENSLIYLKWNTDLNRWDNYYKYESLNDENENMLYYVDWMGNEDNEWVYEYQEESIYNLNGTISSRISSMWIEITMDWLYQGMQIYSYNASGLLDVTESFVWTMDTWQLTSKEEYTYTNTNKIDYYLVYTRAMDIWNLAGKWEYDYDANDNQILRAYLNRDGDQWINNSRDEYVFDQNNNMIFHQSSYWDLISLDWVNMIKIEKSYNENNEVTMSSRYNWDVDLAAWTGSYKYDFIYDEEGKTILSIEYLWGDLVADWGLDTKGFYYYSILINVPEIGISNLMVFPNPAECVVNIKNPGADVLNCNIISISGQQLRQFTLEGSTTQINIESLPKGVYFLQFSNGVAIGSKKLIKL
ncbi:MAG: T9SS type A sorting domain-containing protein [Bacteroidales bacterium]|nr:T9SS type A sorting domain-containing protein [Bacteroidales bacterium]